MKRENKNKKNKTQHTALSQIPRFRTTFNVNTDFRVRERIPTGCAFTGGCLKQLSLLVGWRWKRIFYWLESGSGCRYRGREKVCQTPTGIENQCFTWNSWKRLKFWFQNGEGVHPSLSGKYWGKDVKRLLIL